MLLGKIIGAREVAQPQPEPELVARSWTLASRVWHSAMDSARSAQCDVSETCAPRARQQTAGATEKHGKDISDLVHAREEG